MLELKHLTNQEILIKTKNLAGEERRITTEILHCLREVEHRMLYAELAYSSQPKMIPTDAERVITETLTEISFVADDALIAKLTRIREVISNTHAEASYGLLFHTMADEFLKRKDPLLKIPKLIQKIA